MRTRLLNLALLAALVLVVTRLWLFLGEPPPPLLPGDNGATALPAATAAEVVQPQEIAEFRPEVYDLIVARDLFSTTRGVVPATTAAGMSQGLKPQPPPKLSLYGVVIIDGAKSAYLQEGSQEGRPRKIHENENFAGGVVKTIRPDGVTFLFAGSEINVPLRTPKPGAGTPAPQGQDFGGVVPQSAAPVVFPRRQAPRGVQPGQMPTPGRPLVAAPGMPLDILQVEPGGGEVIEDEDFPGATMPEEEMPGMTEEEAED